MVTPSPTATTSHDGLGADGQREPPLGERHAAEAPQVDVVQPDGAHAKLHLAWRRRRWCIALHQREFAVGQQLQGADLRHARFVPARRAECQSRRSARHRPG